MTTTPEMKLTPTQEADIKVQDQLSEHLNEIGVSHDDFDDIMRHD